MGLPEWKENEGELGKKSMKEPFLLSGTGFCFFLIWFIRVFKFLFV